MSTVMTILALVSLLGAALMAGTFYAFSAFVMKALGRIPAPSGMAAMQSINVVVLNVWFLGVFMGTAVACVFVVVLSLLHWQPGSIWMLAAGLAYVLGTVGVTIALNVPLNEELARAPADQADSHDLWADYLKRWTRWNHLRSVFAVAATLLFAVGLMANAA